MSKYTLDEVGFIHFGDQCAPGIIIDDILQIRTKLPFVLGHFSFSSILNILKCDFAGMYDKNSLALCNTQCSTQCNTQCNTQSITDFRSIINNFGHGTDVVNTKYNITFNHDFIVNSANCKILNYNFIINQAKTKLDNYKTYLKTKKFLLFLNFGHCPTDTDLREFHKYAESLNKKYRLIIFTPPKHSARISRYAAYGNKIIEIAPSMNWTEWWSSYDRYDLYKHLYDLFVRANNDIDLPPMLQPLDKPLDKPSQYPFQSSTNNKITTTNYSINDVGLINFGDRSVSDMIIKHILNIRTEHPFALTSYSFDTIMKFINNDFNDICDKNKLMLKNGRAISSFNSTIARYSNSNNEVINSDIDAELNLHFIVDDDSIWNYDHVVDRELDKLANYKNYIKTKKLLLFINFESESKDPNLHSVESFHKYAESLNKDYRLIVFKLPATEHAAKISIDDNKKTTTIVPTIDWREWQFPEPESTLQSNYEHILKHIYDLFVRACTNVDLPLFEDTYNRSISMNYL